jgi:hypothetical protein
MTAPSPPPIEPHVDPLDPLEPQPVVPLYATPLARSGRPGIISFLGIIAIVIASLSMLACFVGGMMTLAFMIQRQAMKAMTATSSVTVSSSSTGGGNTRIVTRVGTGTAQQSPGQARTLSTSEYPTGPRGIAEPQRLIVEEALSRSRRLSTDQNKRVDQLLAKSGKDIFPFGIATNTMQSAINDAGTLTGGTSIANYYLLGSGKLEIYDDRAIFFPSDGQPVRVHADDPNEDETSNALSQKQIDEFVKTVESQANAKLTPQQITALRNELSDPNQMLVLPGSINSPIGVSMSSQGALQLTARSYLEIDPAGNVMNSTQMVMRTMSRSTVRPTAGVMTLLDTLFSGALAIYLLVVGILVLRQNHRGRGLQLVFAVLKLPVAVLAAIGWIWTFHDLSGKAMSFEARAFWFAVLLLIGIAYPLFLLIALNTRAVREYYGGVTTTMS